MNRFHFTMIFVGLLLGYFLLFEGVTLPGPASPELGPETEWETPEPAQPEMIINPYVKQ